MLPSRSQKLIKKKFRKETIIMKHLKKLIPLMLALVMVLTLAPAAFAAGNGSITIENAVAGQTYTAHKIFDVVYSGDNYSYTIESTSPWFATVQKYSGVTLEQVNDTTTYNVKQNDTFDAVAFAAILKADVANKTGISLVVSNGKATATDLDLGYYFVTTTVGSLCVLNTTNPSISLKDKNTAPTIEKEVKEGETWGSSNTAQIGDAVEFQITVHAKPGAVNYVVHDTMSEGLTFSENIKIDGLTEDKDYTVHVVSRKDAPTDKCTFEVRFTQAYLDTITQDTDIVITYSAVLNEDAVIATGTNDNTAKLVYGDKSDLETTPATTNTSTYEFDLVKTDADNKVLDGAEFELYDASTGGNKIEVVKVQDGVYRVASVYEIASGSTETIKTTNGKVTVQGLDSEIYWLEETKAPDGYNKLASRQEVKIQGENLKATVNEDTWTAGGVHVVNKAGTVLPETGGLGTTLLTTFGSLLVVGAGILLATKRRASMME